MPLGNWRHLLALDAERGAEDAELGGEPHQRCRALELKDWEISHGPTSSIWLRTPHPMKNGIGGGGISTPGIPLPFSLLWGRVNKWSWGTPHPPPLQGRGDVENMSHFPTSWF